MKYEPIPTYPITRNSLSLRKPVLLFWFLSFYLVVSWVSWLLLFCCYFISVYFLGGFLFLVYLFSIMLL